MHKPVLAAETLGLLGVRRGGIYIDGTVGGGGHAELILDKAGPEGRLVGIDADGEALDRAAKRLAGMKSAIFLWRGNFADMESAAVEAGIGSVDGVLLDLGVSSDQLDCAERGFSFQRDGPLDMRMDRSAGTTAGDLVNGLPERDLADLVREYGEDRAARRIARAIVAERRRGRLESTLRLAEIVARAKGGAGRRRIHPATQTFQALRIAVNRELDSLMTGLEAGLRLLRPGGRIAAISFHSLEDRIVKQCFRNHAGREESLQEGGSIRRATEPGAIILTGKPVTAGEEEIGANPRSRTARLRAAERSG